MAISPYIAGLRQKIGNDLLLLPAVGAVVVDDAGRVLLHRASDDGRWYMIGGAMDPGEEPADAVVREVREEVGIDVEPLRITGVYGSPLVTYPNGHQVRYIGTIFLCRPLPGTGEARVNDDESLEVRWFHPDDLPELRPDQRLKIEHALRGDPVGAHFLHDLSHPLARFWILDFGLGILDRGRGEASSLWPSKIRNPKFKIRNVYARLP